MPGKQNSSNINQKSIMEKFFERLAKVGKAKLRNGNEYKWSANVYNPGTGEFTICGYWKGLAKWHFISHNEDGSTWDMNGVKGSADIILEEQEQWVNVIKLKGEDAVCHPKIYNSFYEATSFQKKISMLYLSPDSSIESILAKQIASRLVTL